MWMTWEVKIPGSEEKKGLNWELKWSWTCFANQFLWQVNLVQIQNEGRKWEVWKAREMDDTKFQEKGLCSQVGEQKRVDESRNAVQEE